jgi:hypothetical protein
VKLDQQWMVSADREVGPSLLETMLVKSHESVEQVKMRRTDWGDQANCSQATLDAKVLGRATVIEAQAVQRGFVKNQRHKIERLALQSLDTDFQQASGWRRQEMFDYAAEHRRHRECLL